MSNNIKSSVAEVKIEKLPELSFAASEAINTLCTNLMFSGEHIRKVMVTSAHASEGKSYISINMMLALARIGKSVVLVDADLRRSVLVGRYGLKFSVRKPRGLAHYLAGMADYEDIIYETDIDGAFFIPQGRDVNNPVTLLNSPRFGILLNHMAQEVDYVIIDAPPLGMVIDGVPISKCCDGTLLVIGYNDAHRQELIDVKTQLDQSGCPVIGAVINHVRYDNYAGRKYYRNYYSRSGYYNRDSKDQREQKQKRKRHIDK